MVPFHNWKTMTRVGAAMLAGWGVSLVHAHASEPEGGLTDEASVEVVTIPIYPRGNGDAGSDDPDLAIEDLRVRVNGRQLRGIDDELRLSKRTTQYEQPTRVTVVVDLRSLDPRGRDAVADEIASLAERAPAGTSTFQFYSLTWPLARLNTSFTKSREELLEVAELIRTSNALPNSPSQRVLSPERQATMQHMWTRLQENARRGKYGCLELILSADEVDASQSSSVDQYKVYISLLELLEQLPKRQFGITARRDAALQATDRAFIGASVASLEGLLRLRNAIYPDSPVLLFTSGSLDLPRDERFSDKTESILRLAQRGAAVSIVEVDAAHNLESKGSHLLTMLTKEAGGSYYRSVPGVFVRVLLRENSRYILEWTRHGSQVPDEELDFDITIDTRRRPELWGVKLEAPRTRWSRGKTSEATQARMAALLSPADFKKVPMSIDVGLRRMIRGVMAVPVRARVALADLTWVPSPTGGYEARVSIDLVMTSSDHAGQRVVCELDTAEESAQTISLVHPPAAESWRAFEFSLFCPVKNDGVYVATAVVRDDVDGDVGAAAAMSLVERIESTDWYIEAPRLFASDGSDVIWRRGQTNPEIDVAYRAGRVIQDNEPIPVSHAIRFEYVLCGPNPANAANLLEHRITRRLGDGRERVEQILNRSAVRVADWERGRGLDCVPVQALVKDNSLDPGGYSLDVFLSDRNSADGSGKQKLATVSITTVDRE